MKSRKSFLLRLDPALYEALERWAQHELRSVNGQIEFILKQAVLARDRKALPVKDEETKRRKDTGKGG
ncbi:MAG: ribbon-helix-helix domain-containing protein [Deltaproteobacteria bacterium]